MRKKIVGIFVCTLLISAAVLPVLGMRNNKTLKEKASNNFSKMEDSYAGCFSPVWTHKITLDNPSPNSNESFGRSVSVSGCYAIVGCPCDESTPWWAGSACIYERPDSSTGWSSTPHQIITASDNDFFYFFGSSVSIDGDTAIIGSPGHTYGGPFTDAGKAYIFQRDSTGNWIEQVILEAFSPSSYDYFGWSVSIDGNYAVVGAVGDSGFTGIAYVFDGSSGWSTPTHIMNEVATLTPSPPGGLNDNIGWSVSIDGDYAVVGGYSDTTNKAYVFDGSIAAGGWLGTMNQVVTLTPPPPGGSDYNRFGCSVSIDGDYAVVGASGVDFDTGAAYVFDGSSGWSTPTGTMIPVATLTPPGTYGDNIGCSVSIDGDYAVVGAPGYDYNTGAAYFFDGSIGWTGTMNPVATLNLLLPIPGKPEDYFGHAVDIDHCSVIIGAPGYRGSFYYEGTAYVFESNDVFLDLIIQDNVINPGTITPIGDDTYEPTYWAPGLKQIGSWTAYTNFLGIFHIYSCEIVLENDCFTTLNYIITAQFLPGSPTPFLSFLRYTDTTGSPNSFAISSMPNIGFGISIDPCSSTLLRILIFTIHAPGSGIKIGVNVMSPTPFTQDSVIFHN